MISVRERCPHRVLSVVSGVVTYVDGRRTVTGPKPSACPRAVQYIISFPDIFRPKWKQAMPRFYHFFRRGPSPRTVRAAGGFCEVPVATPSPETPPETMNVMRSVLDAPSGSTSSRGAIRRQPAKA